MEIDKLRELHSLVDDIDNQLDKIREWGRKYGFGNNYMRGQIWKKLLRFDESECKWEKCENCKEYGQLMKDVDRSFNTIEQVKNQSKIVELRQHLIEVLDRMYAQYHHFNYYQGYHDISSVFILVLGVQDGFIASCQAAKLYFKDYLEIGFEQSLMPQSALVRQMIIRHAKDTENNWLLSVILATESLNCLTEWLLTWLSHNIADLNIISRIWDFLLCSHPSTPLYLAGSLIILTIDQIDQNESPDIGVQQLYQSRNFNLLEYDIEEVLQYTRLLQMKYNLQEIVAELPQGTIIQQKYKYIQSKIIDSKLKHQKTLQDSIKNSPTCTSGRFCNSYSINYFQVILFI